MAHFGGPSTLSIHNQEKHYSVFRIMSIFPFKEENFEFVTLQTNPHQTFSSGSNGNVSGSVYVFPRRSETEKDNSRIQSFVDSSFSEDENEAVLNVALEKIFSGNTNVGAELSSYMDFVHQTAINNKKFTTQSINRFTPSYSYTKYTNRKSNFLNVLYPTYRPVYTNCSYGFSNYSTINFYTASTVPSDSVMLYPNVGYNTHNQKNFGGVYIPNNGFSFDFWINCRYTTDSDSSEFKAGTLLHMSSSYCVSVLSGSSKDVFGKPDKFKLMLQLSGSANITPSTANTSSVFVFQSNDNCLSKNNWHHVTIRWGTSNVNNGTGSFFVDNINQGDFVVSASTIIPLTSSYSNPSVLCVGNYYEGTNQGANIQSRFFSQNTSIREGLIELDSDTVDGPTDYFFNHPLNAEVHEVKIYNKFLNDDEIESLNSDGPTNLENIIFYLPPYYVHQGPNRQNYNGSGGKLISPFYTANGIQTFPFSTEFSFALGGHLINLENFVMDVANDLRPRLLNLTGSVIDTPTDYQDPTSFIYQNGQFIKRNTTVLPNDNGLFYPNYKLFVTKSYDSEYYVNDLGNKDYSFVSLRNMLDENRLKPGILDTSGTIFQGFVGAYPETTSGRLARPSDTLSIYQRTRDNTSNNVSIFNISDLYYGTSVKPNSLYIEDSSITGTSGKISLSVRDNGRGTVYRSDANTPHAKWATVGTSFYNEGAVVITAPTMYPFGKDQFYVELDGTQNVHIQKLIANALPGTLLSSSNPSYDSSIIASDYANDQDSKFVYISDVYFHDNNLNVVAKASLAQPIIKRTNDKISFRVKLSY